MGTRQELPELQASTTDDLPRRVALVRDPRDVASFRYRPREVRGRRLHEHVLQLVRQLAHVAKHARPVAGQHGRIGRGGASDRVRAQGSNIQNCAR